MRRVILHLDMDAFFAAVEEMDNPSLRGKPVVVGADPKGGRGRGVVSTANYEARKYGIHSAMPISEAYRRCPHAVFLPVRGHRYAEISRQIMAILRQYTPLVEPLSIDEAFLDLTHTLRIHGDPVAVAREIKSRIRREVGDLTASIGIAPNKFLAKIASDLEKPDGLVVVGEDQIEAFLWPLPVSRLWGVGKKTQPVLEALGIRTIGHLARFPKEELVERFGSFGAHLWELAHGVDDRPVVPASEAKQVSREHTFEQDVGDLEVVERTLLALVDRVTRTLRDEGVRGRTVTLKIRLEDFSTFTRSRTLSEPTDRFAVVAEVARDLLHRFRREGKRVRLIGVGVSNLERGARQLSLFDEKEPEEAADDVVDLVRKRFGEQAIRRAAALGRNERERDDG
ncbi:MAG TPA: DNA polymerase IV [Bacteroidetes bacterium]|nr:DNA polymerase IV [Bacteroidota bacterium]